MFAIKRSLAAALLLLIAIHAGANPQGGSFRLWGHGARDLAMGDASTLMAPGLESLFTQPASLVGMSGFGTGISAQKPTGGVELALSSVALGWGSGLRSPLKSERVPTSDYAFAAAFQHLGATLADDTGWGEWTAAAACAWSPRRWLSIGARGTMSGGGSDDDLDNGRATSLALGARAVVLHPGLEIGWILEDYYQSFKWDNSRTRHRGSTHLISCGAMLPFAVQSEFMLKYRFEDVESWAIGLEWPVLVERLTLRTGVIRQLRVESVWSPSFGFGVAHYGLRLDYGFRFNRVEGPGSIHRLSLLWTGIGL
ncbi:MAG: hypothetical protein GY835_17760 [bacterium]|nr:hypothetical protein [bacterium]